MLGQKPAAGCPEGDSNIILFAEERGVQRDPAELFKQKYSPMASDRNEIKMNNQTDPVSLPKVESDEMPFSDEDEDGPNSFIYYTVPSVIGEVAEDKIKPCAVDNFTPELKKLVVKGELSEREKKVFRYFRSRLIVDLLQFLMNHLLASQPDNPIEYLRGIMDQCLLYRSGQVKESPILYRLEHLESLFTAFDPLKTGVISVDQYHAAMKTLVVRNYHKYPQCNENNLVTKRVFLSNAKMALEENLLDLILLTPSATEKPTKAFGIETTPGSIAKQMTIHQDVKKYMKTLVKNKNESREKTESPREIVEMEGIVKPPLKTPPSAIIGQQMSEKFGDFARPLKHLQQAFKTPSEFKFG